MHARHAVGLHGLGQVDHVVGREAGEAGLQERQEPGRDLLAGVVVGAPAGRPPLVVGRHEHLAQSGGDARCEEADFHRFFHLNNFLDLNYLLYIFFYLNLDYLFNLFLLLYNSFNL